MREDFHNSAGKSSVLRWHQAELNDDYALLAKLAFSHVLVVDELYSRTAGGKDFVLTCVDPINHITLRLIIDKRLDADNLVEALQVIKDLGAEPEVIVSDLAGYYPEAFAQVWPKAKRQLCWFHIMHLVNPDSIGVAGHQHLHQEAGQARSQAHTHVALEAAFRAREAI